ncbi:MAG TPA: hypothetical protein VES39_04645, partial [Rhodospirillales bacterium]|nr:hypothetical protein [Rhodospirillales bacterium]
MGEYRRLVLLIVIMVGVVVAVEGGTLGVLYQSTLDRERTRLTAIARGQAMLMQAIPLDRSGDPAVHREAPVAAALVEAQRILRQTGMGASGEVGIARRDGDRIV